MICHNTYSCILHILILINALSQPSNLMEKKCSTTASNFNKTLSKILHQMSLLAARLGRKLAVVPHLPPPRSDFYIFLIK